MNLLDKGLFVSPHFLTEPVAHIAKVAVLSTMSTLTALVFPGSALVPDAVVLHLPGF